MKRFQLYRSISTNLGLEDILDDDQLCSLFIDFLHKVHSQEAIEFWLEVEMYKKQECGVICANLAVGIYNKYIRVGAEMELSLSFHLKEEIRRKMEEGNV